MKLIGCFTVVIWLLFSVRAEADLGIKGFSEAKDLTKYEELSAPVNEVCMSGVVYYHYHYSRAAVLTPKIVRIGPNHVAYQLCPYGKWQTEAKSVNQ